MSVVPSCLIFISRKGKTTPATISYKAGYWPGMAGSPSLAGGGCSFLVPEDSRRQGGGMGAGLGDLKAKILSQGLILPETGCWGRWRLLSPSVEELWTEA